MQAGAVNAFSPNSIMAPFSGATVDLNSFNQTVLNLQGEPGSAVKLGSATLTVTNGGGSSAVISGTGGVTVNGGTLVLSGQSTYTGATTLGGGDMTLSVNNSLSSGTAVSLAAGRTLNIGVTTQAIGSLAGVGNVTSAAGSSLTFGNDNTSTIFSGVISGGAGITKQGSGTMALSGVNSYTGGTTVSAGTLALSGTGSIASSSGVSLATGATFDIAGQMAGVLVQGLSSTPGGTGAVTLGANTLTLATAPTVGCCSALSLARGGLRKTARVSLSSRMSTHTRAQRPSMQANWF